MSYQGPYNGSDAGDFWLNNPSLANLAGASTTSVSVASARLIAGWERIVHRLLRLRFIQRVFATAGQHLQNYPRSLLRRLSNTPISNERGSPMSPGGGAQASAGPQAAGGAEGMLAQILMQLQRNQAEIARDTRQGLQTLSDSLKAVLKKPGTVDAKGVGKPSELKGSHDEVAKAWKSWSYKFETWFCSQWPAGQQALDDPVTAHDLLNSQLEDIDPIDAHLHVALVSLTQGISYELVYNSRKKCGLDAPRRLCFTYEPHNNRTNIRLLRRILNPPRSTMSTLRSSLDK